MHSFVNFLLFFSLLLYSFTHSLIRDNKFLTLQILLSYTLLISDIISISFFLLFVLLFLQFSVLFMQFYPCIPNFGHISYSFLCMYKFDICIIKILTLFIRITPNNVHSMKRCPFFCTSVWKMKFLGILALDYYCVEHPRLMKRLSLVIVIL
jgi:hypothetical protein